MGLFFTIVYLLTAYLSPATVFGTDIALMHVQEIIVALALFFSLFSAGDSGVMKLTQTWAIFGLCMSVACSMIFNHWLGGGPKMLMEFVPEVVGFFLIVMNCKKKWQLQLVALTLFFCAAFIICRAEYDLMTGYVRTDYLLKQWTDRDNNLAIERIRGLSFLGDPNDFAQFLVSLIPIMFLFWKKGSAITNFLFVYVPCSFLFYGMFLTHSRGSMVAFMAVCIVAFRRKIGVVPAVIIGVGVFVLLTVGGFSGGRDVGAGEDRLAAWATGLMLIRRHPVFGVGYQLFSDYNEITAHNTFVVCAAELGLVGVYCWVMVMLVTVRNAWEGNKLPGEDDLKRKKQLDKAISKQPFLQGIPGIADTGLTPAAVSGSNAMVIPTAAQNRAFSGPGMPFVLPPEQAQRIAEMDDINPYNLPGFEEDKEAQDAELRRMSGLMVICFVGFLTAGWFLSRAYTMCIYVNAGIAAAIYKMARDRGVAPPPMPTKQVMKLTAITVAALILFIEVIVRVDHFMPK